MIQRIFGAIRGAGQQVRERSAGVPIQDGPFGSTVAVGIFRRGRPGQVGTMVGGLAEYRRRYGSPTRDSEAPINVEHFYEFARGAGTMHLVRVTDGTEVAASLPVYDRNVDTDIAKFAPASRLPSIVATLAADNGGRWGGREDYHGGLVDLTSAVQSASVIDLGIATLADKWIGATLRFPDTTYTATVLGNTSAGLFTIEGSLPASITGSSTTDAPFELRLANANEITELLESLAVEITDGGERPSQDYSLFAWVDGIQVKRWEDLSPSSTSDRYWLPQITGDLDNYELAPTDSFAGDPNDPLQRPANFAELPAPRGVAANVVEFQTWRWERSSGGDPHVEAVTVPFGPRSVLTLTFTSATAFSVAAIVGSHTLTLPDGVVDTAYDSGISWLPTFTVRNIGSAASASDTITITSRPLPEGLAQKGGRLYAAAAASEGDDRQWYGIASNTANTVTVSPAVDLTASLTAPLEPSQTGTIDGPFTLAGGETAIFTGDDAATLTISLGAGSYTAAQIASELNDLEATRVSGREPSYVFEPSDDGLNLVWRAQVGAGAGVSVTVGAGTLNAIVGWTAQAETGTAGKIARLQWRQDMSGGYDGISGVTASDYEAIFDVATSPLNDLIPLNTGFLEVFVPGVTTPSVQNAAKTWAYEKNAGYLGSIPATVLTEAAAVTWHETNIASGEEDLYTRYLWPSYGRIASPYGPGLHTTTFAGAVLGLRAAEYQRNEGPHVAPAGTRYNLARIFRDLQSDLSGKAFNNEVLNGYGLTEVRQKGAEIYVWGDRIPGGRRGRPFWHHRAILSHIGRVLLTNTDDLVFQPNDSFGRVRARRATRELFLPWWRAGWFDDGAGPGFDDQVQIIVDEGNNPASERAAGNLNIDICFTPVGTSERVIFTIGPKGLQQRN